MDIASLRAADLYLMPVKGVRGEAILSADGTPCAVRVYGPGSREYVAAQAAGTERMMARSRAAAGKPTPLTADEQIAESAAFLAGCTAELVGFTYRGQAGPEGALALYSDPGMGWLTRQVDSAIADWRNFTPASPTV